jgi:hypothetical protein
MSDKTAEMWAAFEAYQATADKEGHGDSWRVMCKERTEKAAWVASLIRTSAAAPAGSAAVRGAWASRAAAAAAASAAAAKADDYAQEAIKYMNKAMDVQQKLAPEQITIGRLRKRIVKLTEQRDSAQKLNKHYKEIFNRHPFVKSFENKYQKALAERQELESLRKRVKEQEELITRLLNETNKREEKL